MTISLSSASLSVFTKFLGNLRHLLTKAQADVAARGYDEQALVQFRLAPDMLPFKTQICIACDAAPPRQNTCRLHRFQRMGGDDGKT